MHPRGKRCRRHSRPPGPAAAVILLVALGVGSPASGQTTRSFRLASAPVQLDLNSPIGWSFSFDHMAGDLDMVSIHQDFFGIPWKELMAGDPLPPSWVAFQQDIQARAAATGLPVYLSLTPMSSDRVSLAPEVRETGGAFQLKEGWSDACFDFQRDPLAPAVRAAYLEYVDFMLQLFEPEYVTTVIEINEFFFSCPTEPWHAFTAFADEVYAHVKAQSPDVVAFPSFLMDPYWILAYQECPDDPIPCLDESLEPLRPLAMDRFGISSYPLLQRYVLGKIPRGLLTHLEPLVDPPLVVAETGYNSADIVITGAPLVGSCQRVLDSSHAHQRSYMEILFEDADRLDIELVTWWSFRDYLPRSMAGTCPCPLRELEACLLLSLVSPQEQALFRSFGNMGVLHNGGRPKPIHRLWERWRSRPIRP